MKDLKEKSLAYHAEHQGKTALKSLVKLETREDLSLAYTPGVASPCLAIKEHPEDVYRYTSKAHTIAIVSDGSAILGLGNIGPEAGLPVMEGKALLFKKFAGIDAVPLVIATQDTKEIIRFCEEIAPTFAGINLEDISFPRCVEIETALREKLAIPVFHDDQRGTATVVSAALLSALRFVRKKITEITVAMSGLGAAGSAIATMLHGFGVKKITAFNHSGIISQKNPATKPTALTYIERGILADGDYDEHDNTLKHLVRDADVFIGVSAADILTPDDINTMAKDPIIFALANPSPEISYEEAKKSKARVYASGRSDLPNQINNVLVFPGLFKGALSARAKDITDSMCRAAALALSALVSDEELKEDYIIPSIFDRRTTEAVARAAKEEYERNKNA